MPGTLPLAFGAGRSLAMAGTGAASLAAGPRRGRRRSGPRIDGHRK